MIKFKAHSDGSVIIPDEPVEIPSGTPFRVSIEPVRETDAEKQREKGLPLLDVALEISKNLKGNYPKDLARNHNHYLYGRPKH